MVVQRVLVVVFFTGLVALGIGAFRWANTATIPAGHVGVLFSATSGLVKNKDGSVQVIKPRRLYIPIMTQLYVYPTLTQAALYSQDPTWGEDKAADGVQVTTSDNAQNLFDVVVFYRVLPEDVGLLFKTFGAIPITDIQTLHIRRAVKEVVNVVGPAHDAFQLMGKDRKAAGEMMVAELKRRLKPKGITIEKAFFLQAYPQAAVLAKITARVNAHTTLTIANINRQIADLDRQIAVVKATADAKAARIASARTAASSLTFLKLQVERQALEKWGGQLPPIQARAGQTVLIPAGLMAELAAAPAAAAEGAK